ncbi:MAG: hypothetical protein ACRCXD_00035 [Luteolibacter sp.]
MNLKLEIQASESLNGSPWTTLVEKTGEAAWNTLGLAVTPPEEEPPVNGSVPLEISESAPATLTTMRFYRMHVSLLAP